MSFGSRYTANDAFLKIIEPRHKQLVLKMLRDPNKNIVDAAINAFVKITTNEDKKVILEMLNNDNVNVQIAAANAFAKIATNEEKDYLLNILASRSQGWSGNEMEFYELLADLDKKFYCRFGNKDVN